MAKTKALPGKSLTVQGLKNHVERMAEIKAEKKALDKEFDTLEAAVVEQLGVGGVFEAGAWRVCIVQAMRRRVDWKKVAYSLAKILYSEKSAFRAWLKSIVRANRKKACAAFAKLTEVK